MTTDLETLVIAGYVFADEYPLRLVEAARERRNGDHERNAERKAERRQKRPPLAVMSSLRR
jgi:hypothetical protein